MDLIQVTCLLPKFYAARLTIALQMHETEKATATSLQEDIKCTQHTQSASLTTVTVTKSTNKLITNVINSSSFFHTKLKIMTSAK